MQQRPPPRQEVHFLKVEVSEAAGHSNLGERGRKAGEDKLGSGGGNGRRCETDGPRREGRTPRGWSAWTEHEVQSEHDFPFGRRVAKIRDS